MARRPAVPRSPGVGVGGISRDGSGTTRDGSGTPRDGSGTTIEGRGVGVGVGRGVGVGVGCAVGVGVGRGVGVGVGTAVGVGVGLGLTVMVTVAVEGPRIVSSEYSNVSVPEKPSSGVYRKRPSSSLSSAEPWLGSFVIVGWAFPTWRSFARMPGSSTSSRVSYGVE